jgi:phosphate:Na+ symporter
LNTYDAVAPLLGGLGLFFIGVRSLSANLVPLIGQRTRTAFAHALRGPVSSAISGTVAGLLTQSSTAVSWIILGLIRAGMPSTAWVLMAPAWSNVGTALLPILVAINLATGASYVIGLVGFAIYFKLDNTDRRRYALDAAFGAALLLFGMQVVSAAVGPMREALGASGVLAAAQQSFWLLAGIGIGFSMLTQSSSVAAAIAVAGVNNGLLTVTAALPLIAGANAAGIFNNLMKLRGETTAGGKVFMLQTVQKAGGTLLLTIIAVAAMWWPAEANSFTDLFGNHASSQIAIIFTIAQFVGAIISSLSEGPVAALMTRLKPPGAAETLAQPAFLLREALATPSAALDLTMRELARLISRMPMLLDRVRANPDHASPSADDLKTAGLALADIIKTYLANLLDLRPGRNQVAAALLLENAAGNAGALHEALAELAAIAPDAASLSFTGRLVEALHVLMGFVADHAHVLGADDPGFVLRLLGDRNAMMAELRHRLNGDAEAGSQAQDALFRMTILFERSVWLARRLVTDMSQAHQLLIE